MGATPQGDWGQRLGALQPSYLGIHIYGPNQTLQRVDGRQRPQPAGPVVVARTVPCAKNTESPHGTPRIVRAVGVSAHRPVFFLRAAR